MEQEGEEREGREAQTDLERAVPELVLEVDRDEGDEGAEEEVQAEDRGVARSRLRAPEGGGDGAGAPPPPAAGPRGGPPPPRPRPPPPPPPRGGGVPGGGAPGPGPGGPPP